jgi:hypothetical protein
MIIVKWIAIVTLALHVAFGAMAANRAWVQVRSLDLRVVDGVVPHASTAVVDVVTTGRVPVELALVLLQGGRAETVAAQRVPNNAEPFWDPRNKRASMIVALTPAMLSQFAAGPLTIRATATGTMQWLRLPRPIVRERTYHPHRAGP